jgi:hypothetical protein
MDIVAERATLSTAATSILSPSQVVGHSDYAVITPRFSTVPEHSPGMRFSGTSAVATASLAPF